MHQFFHGVPETPDSDKHMLVMQLSYQEASRKKERKLNKLYQHFKETPNISLKKASKSMK